ncbi:MAG TPA: hypothetical protein PKW63_07570 [Vicinamibacterales bacterium]|jgi:lysophospholipase L1-like esterase|nr:hypothetical protein [Acidobacteriota bacterium]HQX81600.1 hypothetical protein [Vicinamibacterales bacterium]
MFFLRRAALVGVILVLEFAALEAGLRTWGAFESSSEFRTLFMDDPQVGVRLRPNARISYSTVEFTTDIAINDQGVRDDEPIGAKAPGERRIVVLGDSLVLSVQVAQTQTFCEQLERQLNEGAGGTRWRVINGGVQGYGPVDYWLFFDKVAAQFEPDIVLVVAYVGNDAIEAADGEASLEAGRRIRPTQPAVTNIRRVVRSSAVLQLARVRWDQLRSRVATGTPERPLATYLTDPPPVVQHGLEVSRRAFEKIAGRARAVGAQTGIVLMPARLQVNDEDFSNLRAIVKEAGGEMDRNGASRRFQEALTPLGIPVRDIQPDLARQPDAAGIFLRTTAHLSPRGHSAVADALLVFLRSSGMLNLPAELPRP